MDFSKINLFGVMNSKLKYHSARQAQISQNVANADTPGYKATDIETPNFKNILANSRRSSVHNVSLKTTHSGHISGSQSPASYRVIKRENTYDLNPDGNNVSVEEEVMRAAENQAEYFKVLNLYRKTGELFKTALGRQGGAG